MNMYRDSCVVAILANGKILKEAQDNTVLVPFGSEYNIRLKNKLRKRQVADVWIDGRIACKGIVIDANGTVDLERFVDGNLTEGRRFKLVKATDSRVAQPNDSENGIVEVNFYPEKDQPIVNTITNVVHDYHHFCGSHCHCNCWRCHNAPFREVYFGSNVSGSSYSWSSNDSLSSKSVGTSNLGAAMAMNCSTAAPSTTPDIVSAKDEGEAAATIEGSQSFQRFSTVSIDVDRDHPVTVRMKLKGVEQLLEICHCGFKRTQEKFCPQCGIQLAA